MSTGHESTARPGGGTCVHQWKEVAGAKSAKGGRVLVCELCNRTLEPDPPAQEHGKRDVRPLILE